MIDILVRYSELGLKSRPVRRYMEQLLRRNIIRNLTKLGIADSQISCKKPQGRLIFSLALEKPQLTEELVNSILFVFSHLVAGISSISLIKKTSSHFSDIKSLALEQAATNLSPGSSFAVRARRVGSHSYTSRDVERELGAEILDLLQEKLAISVDLENPDYTLFIEIRDNRAYIFDQKISGIGGLPQGTQGKIFSVLRGSLADVIAGFLICKRGTFTTPVVFSLAQSDIYKNNIDAIDEHLAFFEKFQPKKKHYYYQVDFLPIIETVGLEQLTCSICDEICLEIINRIRDEEEIAGVSLGNAEKTLLYRIPKSSMIKDDSFIPIYYPLIAIAPDDIKHPCHNLSHRFCLESCPGYTNQKKEGIKPLPNETIQEIVAKADYRLITSRLS
ncbi:MAG: hypothetical protein GF308_09700 [Candidatus Heimdallarchaeota archaeon]|nr:hypothetical protein [Candidatus Heimdallarchaeota archaeon]